MVSQFNYIKVKSVTTVVNTLCHQLRYVKVNSVTIVVNTRRHQRNSDKHTLRRSATHFQWSIITACGCTTFIFVSVIFWQWSKIVSQFKYMEVKRVTTAVNTLCHEPKYI